MSVKSWTRHKFVLPTVGLLSGLFIVNINLFCASLNEKQIEAWLNNETEDLPYTPINEGQLKFLTTPPQKKVHHHHNTLIVYKASMQDGWIKLQQCHEHLDTINKAQVVYKKGKIKNLKIISKQNIEKAWIENFSVQLRNIKKGARICIEADSRALKKNDDGTFTLSNGPFMRRFLDGYFPMRVSMDLRLPSDLKFISILPKQQKGFRVNHTKKGVHFDAWFEGKLYTRINLLKNK